MSLTRYWAGDVAGERRTCAWGIHAFAEGDIETVLGLLDSDLISEQGEQAFDTPRTYYGRQGLLDMFASVNEGLDGVRYTPERSVDLGDRVLVDVQRTGRGALSGAPVRRWQFHLWDIAHGRAVRFRTYADRSKALEAVGLRE